MRQFFFKSLFGYAVDRSFPSYYVSKINVKVMILYRDPEYKVGQFYLHM